MLLRELSPDVEKTVRRVRNGNAAVAETRLARALPGVRHRPSLLLDCRNIVSGMNGTTIAALGICGGLHTLASDWDVTLLASKDACASHDSRTSYPGWQIATTLPARQFTVALRLSQPWHIQEMIDLHAAAAYNAYMFLDTISWDVAYPAPRASRRHLAVHGRSCRRPPLHLRATRAIVSTVASRFAAACRAGRVSLVRSGRLRACRRAASPPRREGFIFVVGNDYDHKDVVPTVELLAAAFPYQSIVALGPARTITPRVKMLQSGTLSEAEIHAAVCERAPGRLSVVLRRLRLPDADDAGVRRNAGGAPVGVARGDRRPVCAARPHRAVRTP